MEGWSLLVAIVSAMGAMVSAVFAYQQKQIANEAKDIALKQTTIAEESKKLALVSATASQESADAAKVVAEEGYRAFIKLHSRNLINIFIPGFKDQYQGFDLMVSNIGNRPCKNICVCIEPEILVLDSKIQIRRDVSVEDLKAIGKFSLNFMNMNINKATQLNEHNTIISIDHKDWNTVYTFTITYEDLSGKKYPVITFQETFRNLVEHS